METANMETSSREYVSVTDTAKMLREALRRNWPGVKFSVRSKSYAGGASITVSWHNGPSGKMVDQVAQRYHGADFDGMVDLKSSVEQILVAADGTIRRVRFGADYVFCRRETHPDLDLACTAAYDAICPGLDWQGAVSRDRSIMCALAELSIPDGEPVAVTAQRVVDHIWKRV
jgi:hypothetical protein